jgi:hypothetical protein
LVASIFRRVNAARANPAVRFEALTELFALLARRYAIEFDAPYVTPTKG